MQNERLAIVASFIVGCAILFAAFGIGWADWGKFTNQVIVMQALMGEAAAQLGFSRVTP